MDDVVIEKIESPVEPPSSDEEGQINPDDLPEPRAKFYVDGVEVYVTAEAAYELDSQTNRLRLVEYRDLVTATVRSFFPAPSSCAKNGRIGLVDVKLSMHWHCTVLIRTVGGTYRPRCRRSY